MRVTPQMVQQLVDDRALRQQCRRLRRPPRKPKTGGCHTCGGKTAGALDINELKRWMAEVINDGKRDLIKKKFGADVLEIRYVSKRGTPVSVKL